MGPFFSPMTLQSVIRLDLQAKNLGEPRSSTESLGQDKDKQKYPFGRMKGVESCWVWWAAGLKGVQAGSVPFERKLPTTTAHSLFLFLMLQHRAHTCTPSCLGAYRPCIGVKEFFSWAPEHLFPIHLTGVVGGFLSPHLAPSTPHCCQGLDSIHAPGQQGPMGIKMITLLPQVMTHSTLLEPLLCIRHCAGQQGPQDKQSTVFTLKTILINIRSFTEPLSFSLKEKPLENL